MEQPPLYSDSDKEIVKSYCIRFIKRNGYIRVGYGVEQAVSGKHFMDDGHRHAFINSVSAILVNTGQFLREGNKDVSGDYDMLLNPNYFLNRSVMSTNKMTQLLAVVTVAVSVLSLVKDFAKSDQIRFPQLQETNKQMEKQCQLVDSLLKVLTRNTK